MQISRKARQKVKEITPDMAGSIKLIAKQCFPNAMQVVDRFPVQKLAAEAVQELRIQYRWEAIDLENEIVKQSRDRKVKPHIQIFENGYTRKQLLARAGIYCTKAGKNG